MASFVADQGEGGDLEVAPVVTQDPVSVTAAPGTTATFTAAASGSPAPTIQWQLQVGAGPWQDVAGATSPSLGVAVSASLDGARYRAVFANAAGSVASASAVLTVAPTAPVVTAQPAAVRASVGQKVSFTAAASGYPTPTVRWQVRWFGSPWVTLPGERATTLTFRASLLSIGTEYRAVFTSTAGTVATRPARLTLVLPGGRTLS